jgi:hypothetical protein
MRVEREPVKAMGERERRERGGEKGTSQGKSGQDGEEVTS